MKQKAGRLFVALTVLATLVAGYYSWRHLQLAYDRATTTALSLTADRELVTGKNLSGVPYRYSASYKFKDQSGTVHSGRQTIDGARYDELSSRAGDAPVTVYYSRSNPGVSSLEPNSSRNVAIVASLIALLGWALIFFRRLGS